MLQGVGVSPGVGIGRAVVIAEGSLDYTQVHFAGVQQEKARLRTAVQAFAQRTQAMADALRARLDGQEADILASQILMANDPALLAQTDSRIEAGECAEAALDAVCASYIQLFAAAGDELLAQRAADIEDIRARLLAILLGRSEASIPDVPPGTVLVAWDLTPSMTVSVNRENVAAFVAECGGMTSHAAVVARGMGACCVSGCGDIVMDEANKKFTLAGKEFHEGDCISLDGSTGAIYDGIIPTVDATIAGEFGRIMGWADKYRTMKVRTNADTPADAKKARELGAEGIGLCRTEHMFFEGNRIDAFREMICAETVEEREAALAKILPEQQGDFEKLYEALEGNPVTIRFLDPPLHEFVPTEEEDIKKLADAQGKTVDQIKAIIDSLHEFNPMMGHRGCRLAVTYPEIAKMQTSAVIRAAINVKKAHPDWNVKPEIMIPLVGDIKELKYVKKFVVETADAEIAAAGSDLEYEVGTMIEIPRAALTADDIAKEADFFCFGTNDLTQMTYGFSRDDAGKFLDAYYDAKIFENDPFAKLDQTGVGKLMEMAIELGKPVNPSLHVGICGEHGGDPSSVEFCNKIGLDYVSCSPFRVPIARLAAAQAAIAKAGK